MLLSGWHIIRCSKANPSEIDPVSFSMLDVSFSIELGVGFVHSVHPLKHLFFDLKFFL